MNEYFSEREQDILTIIGRKKTMTFRKISEELFGEMHASDRPFDMEIAVGNSITRIIKKCAYHKLGWTLVKDRSSGKTIITKEEV